MSLDSMIIRKLSPKSLNVLKLVLGYTDGNIVEKPLMNRNLHDYTPLKDLQSRNLINVIMKIYHNSARKCPGF